MMTKAMVRVILHTDALILPTNLSGVVEFDPPRTCIVKRIQLFLIGFVTSGPDSKYEVSVGQKVGKPYIARNYVPTAYHTTPFWTHTVDVLSNTQAVGNVFYEYSPGKHWFPFTIPLRGFPHSVLDPGKGQSLHYCAFAKVTINSSDVAVSPQVPYFILFNSEPKYALGTPKKYVIAPDPKVDMELSLSATSLRIGDICNLSAHVCNRYSTELRLSLKFVVQFQGSVPTPVLQWKFPPVPGVGLFSLGKGGKNTVDWSSSFAIPTGIFPSSEQPNAMVKYSIVFFSADRPNLNMSCPIWISAQPPESPLVLKDALLKYPVSNIDRTYTFNIPFVSNRMEAQPTIPYGGVEEVSLVDQTSDKFYVDHVHRTTSLTPNDFTQEPPFPYPNWRSVVLPDEYTMYYFRNEWCFINNITKQISFVDPRPPEQRLPEYALSNDPMEILIRINGVRGIPIVDNKEPILSFQVEDYKDVNDPRGQQHIVIKADSPSLEPEMISQDIILSGYTKSRMNVIIKVFQPHVFNETVYGYANIELQYLPSGVEITDWFPLTYDGIGIGAVNVTVSVRNKIKQDIVPISINCVSALTKMWFVNNKTLQMVRKNEEKFGAMRKSRALIEQFDYEVYKPKEFTDKMQYLRQMQTY